MNKSETIILGQGYVANAYALAGYQILDKSKFYYGSSIDNLITLIKDKKVVINCIAKTDTVWTEFKENFRDLWLTNVNLVRELSDYCAHTGKKFVHISTTDLYGNEHDWNKNVESRRDLDLNTDYRFSKYASERVCSPADLILRIRLPFDDQLHPKNLLVKLTKFKRFYHLATDVTYLPDLINATEILVDNNQQGIFNVVSQTDTSMLYIARNLLELPITKELDPHNPHPDIMTEFCTKNVHNVASVDKLLEFYTPQELDSTIINCFNKLLTNGLTVV